MTSQQFLATVYPDGPWALTAINPDRKGVETQTFYPQDAAMLDRWLTHHNGRSNLYWHVNPVLRPITKKAERTDIKEVAYLHVDVDPAEGKDLTAERARILKMLETFNPAPTLIVFSGGGYQAFWKLNEPIPINGDLARAEDAKRYNLQLEVVFKADNCHNVDRLMRLPGTMNLPDAKKRKKGRVAVMAEVVAIKADRSYDLSAFTAAPLTQSPDAFGLGPGRGTVQGNVQRLESVEELNDYGVPDRVKVIIDQGSLADEPKKGDNSRSAWLFDCVCNLVRCGVPDDKIFAVITDRDFGISASVLDCGAGAERYALRQIERAKEEAIDPWLRKLNDRFAVISNIGGRCRVVEELEDPALGRTRLTRQSFEDFGNRWMNVQIQCGTNKSGDPIYSPVGRWWLKHPDRRQYDTVVFSPGKETPGCYNLWKGFGCEARPGCCERFLEHLRTNICNGVDEYYQYLLGWMARAVQHPDSPGQVAVVLRGKRGVGKSFFAKTFGGLFGRHFLQVSDPKHLIGSFNAHLRDLVLIFGDEAFYAGDKKHESVLKMLITEEVLAIEAKGIDVETSPNYTHLILASNDQWVVPAGADERRFFVLDVADGRKQNTEYFGALRKELDTGGREALLHYLLQYDLTRFEVRSVPKTKALHEQKLLSLNPEEEWWYRKLEEGRVLERQDQWVRKVLKVEVVRDYMDYMKLTAVNRRSNETTLGRFLNRMCPGLGSYQGRATFRLPVGGEAGWTKEVTRRAYFWEFPTLAACRKRWLDMFGGDPFTDGLELVEVEEEKVAEEVM